MGSGVSNEDILIDKVFVQRSDSDVSFYPAVKCLSALEMSIATMDIILISDRTIT